MNKSFNISKEEALNISVIRNNESAMSFLNKFSELYNYNWTVAENVLNENKKWDFDLPKLPIKTERAVKGHVSVKKL